MHTKMLELAENIRDLSKSHAEAAGRSTDAEYSSIKYGIATALSDLAYSIRSIFTPRDENASPSAATTNTLTFGGPALRVAFHFDGDRLVRWEILEQREELRGKGIPVFYRECIRSSDSPELSSRILFIRGVDTKKDGNHPIYDEPDHTRATITAIGAEIDQVNREWCEKLGIGKDDSDRANDEAITRADEYASGYHDASVKYRADIAALRLRLHAAEKVMESLWDPDVSWKRSSKEYHDYRTTYPKNGGSVVEGPR